MFLYTLEILHKQGGKAVKRGTSAESCLSPSQYYRKPMYCKQHLFEK